MEEIIDCRGQFDHSIPNGEREFRVENVRPQGEGKKFRYIWELSFNGETEREEGEQSLFPNNMADLLRVLGFEEISPSKFKWDRDLAVGKHFIATVSRAPDRTNTVRQNMTGFKKSDETMPF